MRTPLLLTIATTLTLIACGGEENVDPNNHHNENHENHGTTNHGNAEVDVYVDGLMKEGHEGHLQVVLMSADPAPPDVGDNSWTIRVVDLDGEPIDDAKVTVTPFMPAHGHGTSPADYTGTFTDDGTYEVGPFDLFMPGMWETTVKVEGDVDDMVTYAFMLEG